MEHYERLMGDVHVAVVARAVWERLPKAERPGGYADAQFVCVDVDTLCGFLAESFIDEDERARAAEFLGSAPALTEQVVALLQAEDPKWPQRNNDTSPITRSPLCADDLVGNRALRNTIQEHYDRIGQEMPEPPAVSTTAATAGGGAAAAQDQAAAGGGAAVQAAAQAAEPAAEHAVEILVLRYQRNHPQFDDGVTWPGDNAAGDAILQDLVDGHLSQEMFNRLWEHFDWDDAIEDYFEDLGIPVPHTAAAAAAQDQEPAAAAAEPEPELHAGDDAAVDEQRIAQLQEEMVAHQTAELAEKKAEIAEKDVHTKQRQLRIAASRTPGANKLGKRLCSSTSVAVVAVILSCATVRAQQPHWCSCIDCPKDYLCSPTGQPFCYIQDVHADGRHYNAWDADRLVSYVRAHVDNITVLECGCEWIHQLNSGLVMPPEVMYGCQRIARNWECDSSTWQCKLSQYGAIRSKATCDQSCVAPPAPEPAPPEPVPPIQGPTITFSCDVRGRTVTATATRDVTSPPNIELCLEWADRACDSDPGQTRCATAANPSVTLDPCRVVGRAGTDWSARYTYYTRIAGSDGFAVSRQTDTGRCRPVMKDNETDDTVVTIPGQLDGLTSLVSVLVYAQKFCFTAATGLRLDTHACLDGDGQPAPQGSDVGYKFWCNELDKVVIPHTCTWTSHTNGIATQFPIFVRNNTEPDLAAVYYEFVPDPSAPVGYSARTWVVLKEVQHVDRHNGTDTTVTLSGCNFTLGTIDSTLYKNCPQSSAYDSSCPPATSPLSCGADGHEEFTGDVTSDDRKCSCNAGYAPCGYKRYTTIGALFTTCKSYLGEPDGFTHGAGTRVCTKVLPVSLQGVYGAFSGETVLYMLAASAALVVAAVLLGWYIRHRRSTYVGLDSAEEYACKPKQHVAVGAPLSP